jgi:hypothetical protein
MPPPPASVDALPLPAAPEPERDPKKTARLITAAIVLGMLGLVGVVYVLVTRSSDDPVARRAGGAAVSVSSRVEAPTPTPPPTPTPTPTAPAAPRVARDYSAAALAALNARATPCTSAFARGRIGASPTRPTTAASFDNANGTVREVTVTYRNLRRGANTDALTRCLTAAVQAARFTPAPPEAGFTQVSRPWPMGRALPRSAGGGGGPSIFFPFSTPH